MFCRVAIRGVSSQCRQTALGQACLASESPTDLNLMKIARDPANPSSPAIHPIPINDHDTPIIQTANDDLQSLRNIAFDQSRHAFPSDSHQLIPTKCLSEKLSPTKEEGVNMLYDSGEKAIIPIGEVCRQSLAASISSYHSSSERKDLIGIGCSLHTIPGWHQQSHPPMATAVRQALNLQP